MRQWLAVVGLMLVVDSMGVLNSAAMLCNAREQACATKCERQFIEGYWSAIKVYVGCVDRCQEEADECREGVEAARG